MDNKHREISDIDFETIIKELSEDEQKMLNDKVKEREEAIKNKTIVE